MINLNKNNVDVTSLFNCRLYDFKYKMWNIEWILNVSNKIKWYVYVFTIFIILNEFMNLFDSFLLNFFKWKFLINNIIKFFLLNFLNKCFLLWNLNVESTTFCQCFINIFWTSCTCLICFFIFNIFFCVMLFSTL